MRSGLICFRHISGRVMLVEYDEKMTCLEVSNKIQAGFEMANFPQINIRGREQISLRNTRLFNEFLSKEGLADESEILVVPGISEKELKSRTAASKQVAVAVAVAPSPDDKLAASEPKKTSWHRLHFPFFKSHETHNSALRAPLLRNKETSYGSATPSD